MNAPGTQTRLFDPQNRGDAGLLTIQTLDDPRAQETVATINIHGGIANPTYFSSGFGEAEARDAVRQIGDEVDVMRLNIHSRGGSCFVGFYIGTVFRKHAQKIGARLETVCEGLALSIASSLMMIGSRRVMARDGFMLIHTPWSEVRGNADVIEHAAVLLRKIDPKIRAWYTKHVSLSDAELVEAMGVNSGAGTWYTAEEALDLGFVTEIDDIEAPEMPAEEQDLSGFRDPPAEAVARYGTAEPQSSDEEILASEVLQWLGENPQTQVMPAEDASAEEVLALIDGL